MSQLETINRLKETIEKLQAELRELELPAKKQKKELSYLDQVDLYWNPPK